VILSGKGGTGKTTLSGAFAGLIKNKAVVDCDVDAANLHLVLNGKIRKNYSFSGGKKAVIDSAKCDKCGLCGAICRFDAIHDYEIDGVSCEGCGFCFRICPSNAIEFNPSVSGEYFECELGDKSNFYYARLFPGEGNSGKLVSEIKKKASENIIPGTEWVIVDGPPGIGCPVNASIASADYAVIVTEPTLSGIHDLKRLAELLNKLKIRAGIVINKYDLNVTIAAQISEYAECVNIPVIGSIPFNPEFVKALINGKNIIEINERIRREILAIWWKLELQIGITIN
jgi:MinD superfamily P-loop ATPase